MLPGFRAALRKDLRLLLRDRVGLVFLTLAPIVVITVAGVSLASLYGGPRGGAAFRLPLVDEDGGALDPALRARLERDAAVTLEPVPSREDAVARVRGKRAGAALVVPAGTRDALAAGRPAALLLFTDPVKSIEVATARALVQELRHEIEAAARERAAAALDAARADAEAARAGFERQAAALERDLRRLAAARAEAERQAAAARTALVREAQTTAVRAARAARAEAVKRLATELAPLRAFLAELEDRRRAFEAWAAAVRERAGRLADRFPPPPAPPTVPPALTELATLDAEAVAARILPAESPPLPRPDAGPPLPRLPALPDATLPPLPALPVATLPRALDIEETSATGAPSRLNTFDQNVPGFSVTFLLLGVLLGVSLGLLDERDWGTLDRLRATPTPLAALLMAKLLARAGVGLAQMVLLFAVGWLAFGVSLGPEPWGLLLPTAGIVAAGTAFGLVVAGVTRSREAVLPVGSIVVLTMAAAGGCWWPIDLEPPWMRTAALAFPTTWAMDAFNDLMIRRRPAVAVLGATAVLFAFAAVYLALGLALFRRRLTRG